jgi:hypothetical protein
MTFSKGHFVKVEKYLPLQHKRAVIDNYVFLSAIFYALENGCKWRRCLKSLEIGTLFMFVSVVGVKMGAYSVFLKPCKEKA